MRRMIYAVCMAVLLSGCISKHKCMSGDEIDLPVNIDRFTRKIENDDCWADSIQLKPECVTYFKAHPEIKSDEAKATVFPFMKLKSEISRNGDRLEVDVKGGFLLQLWCGLEVAIAFDQEGQPEGVMHGKMSRGWGTLSSHRIEADFTTGTRAVRSGYLFNAFGKSKTHSGKKRTYYFWIPFKQSSKKTAASDAERVTASL